MSDELPLGLRGDRGPSQQAIHLVGAFAYHFWMMDMLPLRYRNGNQHLHRRPADDRKHVRRKMRAYHVFIQAGVVAQGLLQYLAVVTPKLVWDSFDSWLHTIRPGIPPSEFVVANALRHPFPDFLSGSAKNDSLAEFIASGQDTTNMQGCKINTLEIPSYNGLYSGAHVSSPARSPQCLRGAATQSDRQVLFAAA